MNSKVVMKSPKNRRKKVITNRNLISQIIKSVQVLKTHRIRAKNRRKLKIHLKLMNSHLKLKKDQLNMKKLNQERLIRNLTKNISMRLNEIEFQVNLVRMMNVI